VTPAPRKNARRWMCFLVMNISYRISCCYYSFLF